MNTQLQIDQQKQLAHRSFAGVTTVGISTAWSTFPFKNISKLAVLSGCLFTGCQGIPSQLNPSQLNSPSFVSQSTLVSKDDSNPIAAPHLDAKDNNTTEKNTSSQLNQWVTQNSNSGETSKVILAAAPSKTQATPNTQHNYQRSSNTRQFTPAIHRSPAAPRANATSLVQPAGFGGRAHRLGRHAQVHPRHHAGGYQPIFNEAMQDAELSGSCNDSCGPIGSHESCGVVITSEGTPVAVGPQFHDPQEYIFDGGDHAPSAALLSNGEFQGLDAEDTVMVYETVNGQQSVEPACRAAIYAPRFAAVRKVTRITTGLHATGPQLSRRDQGTGSIDENLSSLAVVKPLAPHSGEALAVIDGFKDHNRGIPVNHTLPAVAVSDFLQPYEDLQLIRNGVEDELDGPRLRRSTAAALAWSNYENVLVTIDNQTAQISESVKATQETVVYELNGKPRVKICKVASHQFADPGDQVKFTIRFDNVGDQPVKSIVIADSLPPRLTYVEDSEQSSLKASFSTQPNDVGSELLRWELEDELKPGEGGVIRFTCEVR